MVTVRIEVPGAEEAVLLVIGHQPKRLRPISLLRLALDEEIVEHPLDGLDAL